MTPFDFPTLAAHSASKIAYECNDHRLICELAASGMFAYYIGTKFYLTAAEVRKICKRYGVTVLSKDNQSNKKTARIRALLEAGSYTTAMICDIVDCHGEMVRTVRKRFGFAESKNKIQEAAKTRAAEAATLVGAGRPIKEACLMAGVSTCTYNKYKGALKKSPAQSGQTLR